MVHELVDGAVQLKQQFGDSAARMDVLREGRLFSLLVDAKSGFVLFLFPDDPV
jgi:hypothetical protein